MDLKELVLAALKEDIPRGDITTDPLNLTKKKGVAKLVAKQDLTLSGCKPFEMSFKLIDASVQINWNFKDGDRPKKGDCIVRIEGPLASLLKSERTALNFLAHLSGIATMTQSYVEKTKGTKTKIIDTRKTLPLLRQLEKDAILHGGGGNHRLNLSTGILIKENHIRAAAGITNCVNLIRIANPGQEVEVEVSNPEELKEALECKVEKVLLDNMTLTQIQECVETIAGRCLIEASGNMSLERIEAIAKTGVDFISVGKLTHSAPYADVSLLFEGDDKK